MVPPTDQLAGLSLSNRMYSRTRAEAQRERRRREREERKSIEARRGIVNTVLPHPDAEGSILGSTRLRYQVGTLRGPIQATAIRGLTADNLSVEAAKAHVRDDQTSYVAIQIVERLRLCIYATPRDGKIVDCSCPDMQGRTSTGICSHIYWLYDRLNSTEDTLDSPETWSVAIPDVMKALGQVTRRPSLEIESLAEQISPVWTDSDEEIDHQVEDMLSVLDSDRNRLTGDYDEEFYATLPQSPTSRFQDLVVPGSFFNTVFALARHDSIFRERLSTAITRERLDKEFLRKVNKRRQAAFAQLDSYVKNGTRLSAREVATCAMKLRDIISKTEEYRERVYESPNSAFDRACARSAVKMLKDVCSWNRDIYADTVWLKEPTPSAPQDRNLFICVVSGWNQTIDSDNQFILNFIIDVLPPQASITSLKELTDILGKLTEYRAPPALISKLEHFIQVVTTKPQPPLTELDNYQSLSRSTTRSHDRTGSDSSNGSCGSNNGGNATNSRRPARRPSNLEVPEAQRRRLY